MNIYQPGWDNCPWSTCIRSCCTPVCATGPRGAAVADLTDNSTLADVIGTVNTLLASLRTAGVIQS